MSTPKNAQRVALIYISNTHVNHTDLIALWNFRSLPMLKEVYQCFIKHAKFNSNLSSSRYGDLCKQADKEGFCKEYGAVSKSWVYWPNHQRKQWPVSGLISFLYCSWTAFKPARNVPVHFHWDLTAIDKETWFAFQRTVFRVCIWQNLIPFPHPGRAGDLKDSRLWPMSIIISMSW